MPALLSGYLAVAIKMQQPHDGIMPHTLLDARGPDHVLAVSGVCRCGWEEREQSFRCSPAVIFGGQPATDEEEELSVRS